MILLIFQQFDSFTCWVRGESATGQIARFWGVRTGRLRRMRRAGSNARKHSLRAGTWLRCNWLEWDNHSPGLAAQPPAVQAGARHAAQANGTTIPPGWRRSRQPFKPARGMPRKLMEQPFPRAGGAAASRSSRRAACRAS